MSVTSESPKKQSCPRIATFLPITMVCNSLQLQKVPMPVATSLSFSTKCFGLVVRLSWLNTLSPNTLSAEGSTKVSKGQPLNAPLPIFVTEAGIATLLKAQPLKAFCGMTVRPAGSLTESNAKHWLHSCSGISFSPEGRTSRVSFLQPAKAPLPIAVTPSGMLIFCRRLQLANASAPIAFTV